MSRMSATPSDLGRRVNLRLKLAAASAGLILSASAGSALAQSAGGGVDNDLSRRVLEALSRNAANSTAPAPAPASTAATPAPSAATPAAPSATPVSADPPPAPAATPSAATAPATTAPATAAVAVPPAPVNPPAATAPAASAPATTPSSYSPGLRQPESAQPGAVTILRENAPAPAAPAAPAAAAALKPQASSLKPLPAASGDTHVIKPGETFSSIAEGIYGDEKKWTAIAQANPLVDPAKLKVGQVIRVPDLKQFEAQRAKQFDELRNAVTKGDPNTIMVQPGDTLSHIATKAYGKATMWPVIYKANRDVLQTPDAMQPGMKLRIPPKP